MSRLLVEISGGLGNQLFQLAAACHLQESDLKVNIDFSPNKVNGARATQIRALANELGVQEYNRFLGPIDLAVFLYKLSSRLPVLGNVEREHEEFSVPQLRKDRNLVRYRGYWQNTKSAEKIQKGVKNFLRPLSSHGIGVHIRRGDYLDPKHSGLHGLLPDSYFLDAINEISKSSAESNVVIYSDSPNLLSELIQKLEYLGWNVSVDRNTDPWLTMSRLAGHKYLIGSNSTFSWWAGYSGLAEKCIFPSVWFTNRKFPEELHFQRLEHLETDFL